MSQASILQMPLHLISLVLSGLDNMQSLGSAILSHSSMYAAFNENSKSIMFRVLLNQIPHNLRVYAAITDEARHTKYRRTRRLHRLFSWVSDFKGPPSFNEDYLRMRLELSGPAFAVSLSKTYKLIERFTDRYLSDTFPLAARDLFGQSQISTKRFSELEIFRIRRAFYRFQLYCNITRGKDKHPASGGQQDDTLDRHRAHIFFFYFPPWVNEQLACIHDYLQGLLSKAFDEVAAHDIEWGAKSVDWLSEGKDNKYKQAFLSYGLHFLFEIGCTDTYDERLRLLKTKGLPYSSRGLATDFIDKAAPLQEPRPHWRHNLGSWRSADFDYLMKDNDGVDDLDSSPFNNWLYVHKYRTVRESVFRGSRYRLRICGYVFWEAPEQGPERNAFRKGLKETKRKGRIGMQGLEGAREDMERSWAERAEVLSNGGHGYWTRGDLSKVVWDDGRKPSESAEVSSS